MKKYECYGCDKEIDEVEAVDLNGFKWCEECAQEEMERAAEAQ